MYDNMILKEVKIETKLIASMLFMLTIFYVQKPISLFLTVFVLSILLFLNKKGRYSSFLALGISILSVFYPQILWISKCLSILLYFLLLSSFVDFIDIRTLLEKSVYKFKNKKLIMNALYVLYWIRNMKINVKKEMSNLKYANVKSLVHDLKQMISRTLRKTKVEVKKIMSTYQMRLYHQYTEKTYLEESNFEKWDVNYLTFHIAILIIFSIFRR